MNKKLKVIISNLNSKYVHVSSAPWCLAAGVREYAKSGAECTVMQSTVNSDLEEFAKSIIDTNADVVSFCCYIWNITKTLELCQKIKNALGCIIVLGGPEVAYRPQDVLQRYDFVDFVLSGEGEFCFPEFLDMLCGTCKKEDVSSLSYRNEKGVVSNPEKPVCKTPPSPVCDEYLEKLGGRICYIESSRGCPYRCAFCLSGRVSGLRFFDLTQVKNDILALSNGGSQTVKFVDRTFNSSETHANEILEFIKENYGKKIPEGVCFHFEIAGDILKESTFEILKSMPKGAVQLEIGMQSFNEKTLVAINRKTNTEKLIRNIIRLISFGNMHIHIDLIAGLTGEDIKSFENSFDIGYSLRANMLQMGFLKLLHGADMRENPEKYPCTFQSTPPYEVTSTPYLSQDEIKALKNCEDALDRMYNSGRFLFTLDFLLNCANFTPFKLFYSFGNSENINRKTLCDYTLCIYNYFSQFCDKELLAENLVCDLICSSNSAQIPKSLITPHPLYKKVKAYFGQKPVKIALLPKQNKVLVANISSERDLWGRVKSEFIDLSSINI